MATGDATFNQLLGYRPIRPPETEDAFFTEYCSMISGLTGPQKFGAAINFTEWYVNQHRDELRRSKSAIKPIMAVTSHLESIARGGKPSAHDKIVQRAIEAYGRDFFAVRPNVEYSGVPRAAHYVNPLGELDLLGLSLESGVVHYNYLEIKTSGSDQELRKAKSQVRRWGDYMRSRHSIATERLHAAVVFPVNMLALDCRRIAL